MPVVRFDWRNPINMEHLPHESHCRPAERQLLERFLSELPTEGASREVRCVREALQVALNPAVERVPDEILPEVMVRWFEQKVRNTE